MRAYKWNHRTAAIRATHPSRASEYTSGSFTKWRYGLNDRVGYRRICWNKFDSVKEPWYFVVFYYLRAYGIQQHCIMVLLSFYTRKQNRILPNKNCYQHWTQCLLTKVHKSYQHWVDCLLTVYRLPSNSLPTFCQPLATVFELKRFCRLSTESFL